MPTRQPSVAWRLCRLGVVESTNTLALHQASDAASEGLVITAEEQTAGRGRRGRTWSAPAGSSLLLSVILRPPPEQRQPVRLTILGAVSVCQAIHDVTRLRPQIKWPNDVLIDGKKVAGLLVELTPHAAVLGIGLNVNVPASFFTAPHLAQGSSLAAILGREVARDELLTSLLRHLGQAYERLCAGAAGELEAQWRFHSGLLGHRAEVLTPSRRFTAEVLDLSFTSLTLRADDGQTLLLPPEELLQLNLVNLTGPEPHLG